MTKTQILWSGGVESTSLLKWLLENTDDFIIAHHIKMHNIFEDKVAQEWNAVQSLMPHLLAIREFKFVVSSFEIANGRSRFNDIELLMPMGFIVHRGRECDRTLRGLCIDDNYDTVGKQRFADMHAFCEDRARIVLGMMRNGEDYKAIFPWHETNEWTKKEHWTHLGDLAPLTWTCRRPVDGVPCGDCKSCKLKATVTL